MLTPDEFVQNLKDRYQIDSLSFDEDLLDFLVTSDFFSCESEMHNGEIYIDENYLESKTETFCRHYNLSMDKKIEALYQMVDDVSEVNEKYFREFVIGCGVSLEAVYYILNFMAAKMGWDISEYTNSEIEYLLDEAADDLIRQHYDIFVEFLVWCMEKGKTAFKTIRVVKRKSERVKEAYDLVTYGNFLFHFFNEEYIKENSMYIKALECQEYADIWLYFCMRLVCALRNSDLVRIPHPTLRYPAKECMKKIREGKYSEEDALFVLQSVTLHFEIMKMVPNKTRRFDNVPNIQLIIPHSLKTHFGILFTIAECHMQLSTKEGQFIKPEGRYRVIRKVMGEEIAVLFKDRDFSAIAAAKSFLQIIYNSDSLVDVGDEFKMKGYYLAALARSHKGSYGEFQKTTIRYLRDHKLTGRTPEVAMRELFERGSLSFVIICLLKVISQDEFDRADASSQTRMIVDLGFTPLMAENTFALASRIKARSSDLINSVLSSNSREDITLALHRIGSGDAVNRENGQCILMALGKECTSKGSCVNCSWTIGDEFSIYVLSKEIIRLKQEIEKNHDRLKHISILKQLALKLDEFLVCYGQMYGEKALKILTNVMRETVYEI